jgi:hypothetical protein
MGGRLRLALGIGRQFRAPEPPASSLSDPKQRFRGPLAVAREAEMDAATPLSRAPIDGKCSRMRWRREQSHRACGLWACPAAWLGLLAAVCGCASSHAALCRAPSAELQNIEYSIAYGPFSKDCLSSMGLEPPPEVIVSIDPVIRHWSDRTLSGGAIVHGCMAALSVRLMYLAGAFVNVRTLPDQTLTVDGDGRLRGAVQLDVGSHTGADAVDVVTCKATSSVVLTEIEPATDAGFAR